MKDIRSRWKDLRDAYGRALKKIEKNEKLTAMQKELVETMSFLKIYMKQNNQKSDGQSQEDEGAKQSTEPSIEGATEFDEINNSGTIISHNLSEITNLNITPVDITKPFNVNLVSSVTDDYNSNISQNQHKENLAPSAETSAIPRKDIEGKQHEKTESSSVTARKRQAANASEDSEKENELAMKKRKTLLDKPVHLDFDNSFPRKKRETATSILPEVIKQFEAAVGNLENFNNKSEQNVNCSYCNLIVEEILSFDKDSRTTALVLALNNAKQFIQKQNNVQG